MTVNTTTLRSIVKYGLCGLLALTIVCALVISWLIATQSGLQWLSQRALSYSPDVKSIELEGKLIGPLTIRNLEYSNQEIEIKVKEAGLEWQPSELLLSTVIINYITASDINIKQLSEAKPKTNNTPSLTLEQIFEKIQLPISILIEKAEIKNLSYDGNYYKKTNHKTTDSDVIHLETFLLSAKSDSEKIKINTLEFKSNLLNVEGALSLGLTSSQNTSGNFQWNVMLNNKENNIANITGTTQLSGNTQSLKIDNNIAAPYSTSLTVDIDNLLKKPNALAAVNFKAVDINAINKDWPDYQLNGNIALRGDIDKADFNSTLLIAVKNNTSTIKKINLTTQGDWKDKILNLQLGANAPTLFESITINSVIKPDLLNTQSNEAMKATINWKNYNKPQASVDTLITDNNIPIIFSPSGEITLNGSLEQYQFSLDSKIKTVSQKQQQGQFTINGNGSMEEVVLTTINLKGPAGSLNGDGNIKIKAPISANLTLSGTELNPGIFSPQWPGQLALNAIITTEIKNNQPIINVNVDSKGTLRAYPFLLNIKGNYKDTIAELENVSIESGSSSINAKVLIDKNKKLSAQWDINSNKLQELIPDMQGKLTSKGKIESLPTVFNNTTVLTPVILASLNGSSIIIDNNQIDNIDASIDIDWQSIAAESKNQIEINATKISSDSITISSFMLAAKGKLEDHTINTRLDSDKGDMALKLTGALNGITNKPEWLFTLDSANLKPNDLPAFMLTDQMQGKVNASQQEISQHCWSSTIEQKQTASLCLKGRQTAGVITSEFTINEFPSEYIKTLLPDDVTLTNIVINGKGKINLIPTTQQLDAAIELNTSAGELNWLSDSAGRNNDSTTESTNNSDANNKVSQSLHFEAGKLSINSDNKKIDATLILPIEQQTGIKGVFSIINSQDEFINRPLGGKLEIELDNLAPLVSFIPDASELKGILNSEWKIGGSIKQPWLDGELTLKNGQIRLNSPGVLLENISLNLQGNQKSGINYIATAKSAGGILNTKGNIELKEQGPEVLLSIKGKDFQIFNTSEAIAYISPELTITSKQKRTHIEGSITIPQASITPKQLPESVITTSEDQIIINSNGNPTTSAVKQQLSANINLILGNNVSVDAFGFKGKTSGSLQVSKESQGPTLGNGKISIIDGEYRAFGQGLVIDKGEILFTDGPIGKPGIDIKALRRPAEGISVGVIARGRAAQPDLTIFSEPAMTQTEQLSWLILGRPPEQSSEGENNAISQLLLSFTLSKGDSYLNNFRDTFNLDTLSIKTGSGEAGAASDNDLAELVLGKYLSPELYVSYGIGLFKPVNVLSLEYSLGKRWKLKSETSSESSGGDLVYTIER